MGQPMPVAVGIKDYTNFRGLRERGNARSEVGNQGISELVMLIASFVGPDPNRKFGSWRHPSKINVGSSHGQAHCLPLELPQNGADRSRCL